MPFANSKALFMLMFTFVSKPPLSLTLQSLIISIKIIFSLGYLYNYLCSYHAKTINNYTIAWARVHGFPDGYIATYTQSSKAIQA